jgi:hypothetical protein
LGEEVEQIICKAEQLRAVFTALSAVLCNLFGSLIRFCHCRCLTAAGCGILEDHQHHHGSEVAGGVVQQRLNSFPAGAVSAATAAAVDGSRSSSSIKRAGQGFSQHRSLRRQLLHLEAMQSASSADALHAIDTAYTTATASTAALVNLYPREAAAVQQCLQDALSSGQGPKEIPVWFVVVSDPT